jgi:hypothetical protein
VVIASRTPEGDPNYCPVCGNALRLEPSLDTGDGPCPYCGHLVWFAVASEHAQEAPQSETSQLAEVVLRIGTVRFGPPPPLIRLAIHGIPDADRLISMAERAVAVASWDELFPVV